MSDGNTNALAAFNSPTLAEVIDTIGITQFPSETNWHHTIAGLLIQGGKITAVASGATVAVSFNAGYSKQVLGIFVQAIGTSVLGWSVTIISTSGFSVVNAAVGPRDFYWWAIGV